MLDDHVRGAAEGRTKQRPIHCQECTIQIGEGYQEPVPFEFVDESGPHTTVLRVCWRCWESLNRRKQKRASTQPIEPKPGPYR
jgi:hypothetical protein